MDKSMLALTGIMLCLGVLVVIFYQKLSRDKRRLRGDKPARIAAGKQGAKMSGTVIGIIVLVFIGWGIVEAVMEGRDEDKYLRKYDDWNKRAAQEAKRAKK